MVIYLLKPSWEVNNYNLKSLENEANVAPVYRYQLHFPHLPVYRTESDMLTVPINSENLLCIATFLGNIAISCVEDEEQKRPGSSHSFIMCLIIFNDVFSHMVNCMTLLITVSNQPS